MSKIHLLSENVCNKIAAGEVIERPASVVKELVENSLDAGSLHIVIAVERAGQKLISVSDDGEGMDEDDAIMCLESHATSKIRNEEDILAIHSFGFRGEALPSIASVSKMTVRTRKRESTEGVEVIMHGGKLVASTPAGCAPGTEMIIRDLFYNVPARKKFVKSQATEERHIIEGVTAIALAHPEASFELKIDSKSVLSSPGAENLVPRINEIFGRTYMENMLPIAKEENGITVTGFISKRAYTRTGRSEQRIYVNGRCVESAPVYKGIREGCGPTLERGRYQCAIIFISLDPALVDVNVHPAKREVRFRDDFAVTDAVRSAVTTALRSGDSIATFTNYATPNENTILEDDTFNNAQTKYYPSENKDIALDNNIISPIETVSVASLLRSALVDYHVIGTQVQTNVYTSNRTTPQIFENEVDLIPIEPTPEPETDPDSFKLVQEDKIDPPKMGDRDLRILGVIENSYIVGAIRRISPHRSARRTRTRSL